MSAGAFVRVEFCIETMSTVDKQSLLTAKLLDSIKCSARHIFKHNFVRPPLSFQFILLPDGLDGNPRLLRGSLRFFLQLLLTLLDLFLVDGLSCWRRIFFRLLHRLFRRTEFIAADLASIFNSLTVRFVFLAPSIPQRSYRVPNAILFQDVPHTVGKNNLLF